MGQVAEPQTLPSPKPYRSSEAFFSLEAPRERLADSERGDAYEQRSKRPTQTRIQKPLTVLPSANMC